MSVSLRKYTDKAPEQMNETEVDLKEQRKQDIKLFIIYSVLVSIIFAAVTVSSMVPLILGVACCVWALFGPDKIIQAFTLLTVVRFFNPSLAFFTIDPGVLTWVLLLIAAFKHIPWGFSHIAKQLMPIVVFCFFATFLSMASSKALDISLLKIIAFFIGSLAIISLYNRMTVPQIRNVVIWVMALMSMVAFYSLLILPNKAIAYNLNDVGFQGILNHPQTLGPFLAPLTAFMIGRFVFEKNSMISWKLIVIGVLIMLILLTQARTSAVSVFLSVVMAAFFLGVAPIKAKIVSKGGFISKAIVGTIAILLVLAVYKPAQEMVMEFVFKRDSENIDEALSSRAGGYSSQMDNFLESPIVGHGFGVYPGAFPSKNVRYFMGIPISAAVEKGFLPTAVLEEVGIVGMFAFIYLIVSLTRSALRTKDAGFICLYFSCLFINIGEAVFFAVGGMGIFYWSLIGLSTVIYKKGEVTE